MAYLGRREIFTDETEITRDNICAVLADAFTIHNTNSGEIKYLQEYERGNQPILQKTREDRKDINNCVVENHANEITSFKVGYEFGTPITYVQRAREDMADSNAETDDNRVAALNEMMFGQSKASQDQLIGKDIKVCGVGYRIVLPGKDETEPFKILRLNPRMTFVVKFNDIFMTNAIGVTYTVRSDGTLRVGAYTKDRYYILEGSCLSLQIKSEEANRLGEVPIIEYVNDNERMGCFERVIPLLDAINTVTSNRVDDIQQFVQAFLWINNADIDPEQLDELRKKHGIVTKSDPGSEATVKYLTAALDQGQTQTLVNYLYDQILQIAGVPGREASTGGNTGQAIILSNGWQIAETHARVTEMFFDKSERDMLRLVLKYIETIGYDSKANGLTLSDIEIKFSRNKTDSLLVKTQGLINQLQAGIHPLTAITTCGLYSDPQSVWNDSRPYLGKWLYDTEDMNDTIPDNGRSGGEYNLADTQTVPAQ